MIYLHKKKYDRKGRTTEIGDYNSTLYFKKSATKVDGLTFICFIT